MKVALPSLLLVAACAAVPKPASPLSDARVIADSHDILTAFDRADRARLDAVLAQGFVRVDGSDTTTRAEELKDAADENQTHVKRTWSEERVIASPDVITYRGLADEEPTGNEIRNFHFRGYYTLIWVRENGSWRLDFLGWQQANNASEDTWNAIYKEHVGAALENAFAGWQLLKHEVVEDTPDWAKNRAELVRFVAKKP